MIKDEKNSSSLHAINKILVIIRFFAGSQASSKTLYDMLDYAELLPLLIADKEDRTELFHKTLFDMAERWPMCKIALDIFEDT